MIKALFFDVDGTLVSFNTHKVPESTIEALREAHKRGVKLFTATGRPRQLLNNITEVEDIMDGFILATGAQCVYGDKVVRQDLIPTHEAEAIVDFCNRLGVPAVVVGTKDLQIINRNDSVNHVFYDMLKVTYNKFDVPVEEVIKQGILQIRRSSPRTRSTLSYPTCQAQRLHVGILRSATLRLPQPTRRTASAPLPSTWASTSTRRWRSATAATTLRCCVQRALASLWAMRSTR